MTRINLRAPRKWTNQRLPSFQGDSECKVIRGNGLTNSGLAWIVPWRIRDLENLIPEPHFWLKLLRVQNPTWYPVVVAVGLIGHRYPGVPEVSCKFWREDRQLFKMSWRSLNLWKVRTQSKENIFPVTANTDILGELRPCFGSCISVIFVPYWPLQVTVSCWSGGGLSLR